MSLSSWFAELELWDDFDANEKHHQPHPEPIHSRPCLECLEERTLLDASSGLIGGASGGNLNLNLVSSGVILPTAPNVPNTTAVTPNVYPNAGAGSALAVSSAFMAQDQANSQFRDFAINSQGADFRLGLNSQVGMMTGAYGFGSGTQPNAPWKPNAYNLGLANHQFNYSTQADNGFSSVPTSAQQGAAPVAQSLPKDQNPSSNADEKGTDAAEQLATTKLIQEQEQSQQQNRRDRDFGEKNDDLKALMEQQTSEKRAPVESAAAADGVIPDPLLLSTLAPAQMAALIVGLPGMPSTTEGDDAGTEAAE